MVLAAAGCGGDDGSSAAPDAETRPAECVAQDERAQQALDDGRTTPNAVLAVRNAACGTSVYVSGDASNANVDSLWRIGSVSKTFVAASIMSLTACC